MKAHRVVAIVAVLGLMAAACSSEGIDEGGSGGGGGDTVSPEPTEELVVDTPDPSGDIDTFSFALDYEPSSLDWVYAYNYGENTTLSNLCENLLRLTPEYEIVPSLAESFDHPDDTTWVYTIRQGVAFHDGSPMTTDDVLWSLQRHLDPDVGSYWGAWLRNVESIDKTGEWEITVTLSQPDVVFHQMMATPAGGVGSQAYTEDAGGDYGTPKGGVNCTGPLALKEWVKGERFVFERHEDYWDPTLRAHAAEIEIPFVTNEATLVSALVDGQIDGTFDVPPAAIEQLQATDAGTLYFGPSMQTYDVIVSSFDGALGDPRIRKALMLALDREGIVSAAVNGRAQLLKAPVPQSSWGYGDAAFQAGWDALPPVERDLEAAQALVDEAGVPSEPIVLANLAEDEELLIISTALQDAATQLGMTLEIETLPVGKYAPLFFDAKAREGIDMFLTGWYTDVPEPLNMYATIFTSDGDSNYNGYSNAEYDALIQEAVQLDDPDERAELIAQAQAIAVEEAPWIPLYAPNVRLFLGSRISGAPASFVYLYYPWAAEIGAA
jgi:peptide/nickel transport system substrate-binding protein